MNAFAKGFLMSGLLSLVCAGFLINIKYKDALAAAEVVRSPFAGTILVWLPCCNGILMYTSPTIEEPYQARNIKLFPYYLMEPVEASGIGLYDAWVFTYGSGTLGSEVALSNACAQIAYYCIPASTPVNTVFQMGTSILPAV